METKIVCPDCELEVDRLTSSGMCVKCYKRMQNMKCRGQEYIPLKAIKGTKEYNRAMGRRLATEKRHNDNIKSNTKSKKSLELNVVNTEVHKVEGYDYIDINSNKVLEVIDQLKYWLDNMPKMEQQVTALQEEMLLITHQKTETNGPGDPAYDQLALKEFAILKYRRQLKDALVYLRKIDRNVINDDLQQNLIETRELYERDSYIPKYDKSNEFIVSVNVSGLHGCSKVESFRRHVYAANETAAKTYVEDYLKKLHNVVIFGKSWKIEEVTSNDNN